MALLTNNQINLVFSDGVCSRAALFAVKNVDAADTADLAPWFTVVKRAGIVSDTGTHIASCTITAPATIVIPAGPVDDALWLLVVGVST